MSALRTRMRSESGQAMVFLVFALLGLVGMVSLVIDAARGAARSGRFRPLPMRLPSPARRTCRLTLRRTTRR